jgi:hypothetical protein
MSEWIDEAMKTIVPGKLFGDLWFESEMVILFSSSGVGKTIMGYQTANDITKGTGSLFPENSPQIVVYVDLELSAKQIESRYSNNFTNHYQWSPNFYRVEINPDSAIPENEKFDEFLMRQIEIVLLKVDAKILIVDNITYFRDDQEKGKDALKMMKQLKALKKKLNLSILILAHTPKRDATKPITRNDISGSSMIINFTDSAFAIGESSLGKDFRYIKQIKPGRFSSTVYDSEHVINCQIIKPDNFTKFEITGYGSESQNLKINEDVTFRDDKIMTMKNRGASTREIGEAVNLTHTQVLRIQKKYEKEISFPI